MRDLMKERLHEIEQEMEACDIGPEGEGGPDDDRFWRLCQAAVKLYHQIHMRDRGQRVA